MLFVYQYNRRISYDIGRILIMYFPYQTVNRDQFPSAQFFINV